jgi:queuine/archaeosine tRNA-ribosyltransferase
MQAVRESISNNSFAKFKQSFLKSYNQKWLPKHFVKPM